MRLNIIFRLIGNKTNIYDKLGIQFLYPQTLYFIFLFENRPIKHQIKYFLIFSIFIMLL